MTDDLYKEVRGGLHLRVLRFIIFWFLFYWSTTVLT